MKGETTMTEVIAFLIAFTAAALAICMVAVAVAFAMMTKVYLMKSYPDKEVDKKEEEES